MQNSTVSVTNSQKIKLMKSYESPKRFVGRLQATTTRLPQKPNVDYAKGGCDFRTPSRSSSMGKQVLGLTAQRVSMGLAPRFTTLSTNGVGPNIGQTSSMRKQAMSNKPSAPSFGFGTSMRGDELKKYTLHTSMRRWRHEIWFLFNCYLDRQKGRDHIIWYHINSSLKYCCMKMSLSKHSLLKEFRSQLGLHTDDSSRYSKTFICWFDSRQIVVRYSTTFQEFKY